MRNVTKDGIGETHNLRTNITLHSLLFLLPYAQSFHAVPQVSFSWSGLNNGFVLHLYVQNGQVRTIMPSLPFKLDY